MDEHRSGNAVLFGFFIAMALGLLIASFGGSEKQIGSIVPVALLVMGSSAAVIVGLAVGVAAIGLWRVRAER